METTDQGDLSDIELTFQVNYYLPQRTAAFGTMSHTGAAEEYGVKYQLGLKVSTFSFESWITEYFLQSPPEGLK